MLDLTLNTPFIPGTNLNGDLACADWRFLLPRLSYKHILFIGKPHEGDLQVMHGMSPLKTVITTREHKEKKLAKLNSGTLAGTTFLPMPSPGDNFSIYEESVDLMVLADLNLYKKLLSQKATQNKIGRLHTASNAEKLADKKEIEKIILQINLKPTFYEF